MRIETKNLIIRNFEMKDKDDLCEYLLQRVDEIYEACPDFTVEKAEEEVAWRSESDEFYAVELKEEHKVIGNIYFGKRDFEAREIGYVFNKNYFGHGYASEAAKAVMLDAFAHGTRRVFGECCPENTSSWKVMERIGLKREAHFRKDSSHRKDENGNPIYWDTYVYAALKEDFE